MYRFIWKHSKAQQIATLILIVASFPFTYFGLDVPKTIVNKAIGDGAIEGDVPVVVFGIDFTDLLGLSMGQIPYLFILCGIFLALVIVNGMFKMRINTFKGVMAERLLRRLRFMLLERTMRFPLPQFQKTSSGEVVTMVTAEVEPLGGFFGDAFALPAFQGGFFLTIIAFLFIQNPFIGLAAIALVPVQGYVIPKLQKKINLLGKDRTKNVRALSNRIGEVVGGVQDVRGSSHSNRILADFSKRLGTIFKIRFEIYQRKFFMKFINNFINQMTPFLFFTIGGYLVIEGELTVGALVAALAAYKELAAPWKELLNYYQRMADATIKYEQLTSQFQPQGMLDEDLQRGMPDEMPRLNGKIEAAGLTWADEDGVRVIDSATFTVEPGQTIALTSTSGASRDVFSRLMSRILSPTGGKIQIGGTDIATLHENVIAARVGLATSDPAFFNGSIADNMLFGLQSQIPEIERDDVSDSRKTEIEEAIASGNLPNSFDLDWTDYQIAGVSGRNELLGRSISLLTDVELEPDMYGIGLRQSLDPGAEPELADQVLQARNRVRDILSERRLTELVQNYDADKYNTYTSVAGNILFGKAMDDAFEQSNLSSNPIILELLEEHGLTTTFQEIGLKCAELIVDLFKDIPAGHPFFEQYSFVDEEVLPDLKLLVRRTTQEDGGELTSEDHQMLMSLPFKLTVQRHRLGLIDDDLQATLLQLRHALREKNPTLFEDGGQIYPYVDTSVNPGLSILDNILFGRIVHGRADAAEKINAIVEQVVVELGMREAIVRTALTFQVGLGGGRLALGQRQKLGLVRQILKSPDILICAEPMNAVEPAAQERIAARIRETLPNTAQIWTGSEPQAGLTFDSVLEVKGGRIAASGSSEAAAPRPTSTSEDDALGGEARKLQELPLFANIDPSRLKFLAFTAERLNYMPGDDIMTQGDDGDAAHVIMKGSAAIVVGTGKDESKLFVVGENQLVGEIALLCDTKRTATVRAETEVTTLRLSREVFSEMARQDANFAFEMTRDMGDRLVRTTDQLNQARDQINTLSK